MQDPIVSNQESVSTMFDQIAPTYDRINRILSMGIDGYWRRQLALQLPQREKIKLLDCATGTGDQLLSLLKHSRKIYQAIGIDLADDMLKIGRKKLEPYSHQVSFLQASATSLPFLEASFDCATISFGIRNVGNVAQCLKELYRVLQIEGRLLVLEFSLPSHMWVQKPYLFYLNKILPRLGKLLSKHPEAYAYLARTIQSFPQGEPFCSLMREAGFQAVRAHPLSLGVVTLYQGDKT